MATKRRTWSWISTLYFAEGLPYFAVMTMAVIMYQNMGLTDAEIAFYTSWLSTPWIIKPLWSPFIDLVRTKRFWVLAMQAFMAAAFASIALTLPTPFYLQATMAIFALMAFASATHDIAADGYYMLALTTKEQSFFVGIRNTFYRCGSVFGQGILVMLAGLICDGKIFPSLKGNVAVAWAVVFYLLAAIFIGLFLYHSYIMPRLETDRGRGRYAGRENTRDSGGETINASTDEQRKDSERETINASTDEQRKDSDGELIKYAGREVRPAFDQELMKDADRETYKTSTDETGKDSDGEPINYVGQEVRPAFDQELMKDADRETYKTSTDEPRKGADCEPINYVGRENYRTSGQELIKDADGESRGTAAEGLMKDADRESVKYSDGESRSSAAGGLMRDFVETVVSFFEKEHIGLMLFFILTYRLGESQLGKIAPLFVLAPLEKGGLGLSTTAVGGIYGTLGVIALLLGGIVAGIMVSRKGLRYWILPMALAINVPDVLYVLLAWLQCSDLWLVIPCVVIEQFGYGVGFAAYMLYLIYISTGEHKTSHYAIATGLMAAGVSFPGMISGYMEQLLGGYTPFFVFVCLCTLPGIVAAVLIRRHIPESFGKE